MERDVLAKGRHEFHIRHHAFRLATSLTYGQVYRLHIRDMGEEQTASIVAYLRHEGFSASVVASKAFRGHYIQFPPEQGELLHKLVDRLDLEHRDQLLEIGQWLANKEGWRTIQSADRSQVMRLDASSLSREQQDAIFAFLHDQKIAATLIISKTFRTPYIQINKESVQDFVALRARYEKEPLVQHDVLPEQHTMATGSACTA